MRENYSLQVYKCGVWKKSIWSLYNFSSVRSVIKFVESVRMQAVWRVVDSLGNVVYTDKN